MLELVLRGFYRGGKKGGANLRIDKATIPNSTRHY